MHLDPDFDYLAIGSPPSATIRFVSSSDSIIDRSSLLNRSMMARGIPH
jgi:hypothetical protein